MSDAIHTLRLANGLQVIFKEVHASPVVSTWIWYRVGSRNEDGLPTGLSHWVEHMLFKGTERYPRGSILRLVSQHGGYANAMTSQDSTAYYATVASERADLVLDYEADRMSGALFDPDEIESERSVILSEREGGENEPRHVLSEEVTATAFRRHPYKSQTIGWREDLLRITRDDLYNYYRTYYVPSNAVLIMVGDLDTQASLQRIERLFGGLPSGAPPAKAIPAEPDQIGERRVNLRLPGAASLIEVAYRVPEASHPDFLPLVATAALLSGGKAIYSYASGFSRSARLYRALVEGELTSSVDCDFLPSLDPYLFSLSATVRQGVEPAVVEEALFREIEHLQETPAPPDELAVAIRQTQAQFAYSSESVTSHALTLGLAEMVDRVDRLETAVADLTSVTPGDIMRVSQTYLNASQRTVGWFIPEENDDGGAAPGSASLPGVTSRRHVWAYQASPPRTVQGSVTRATLDNGITVLLRPRNTSAAVSIAGRLLFGAFLDRESDLGIAYLTAMMLRRGTRSRTFQEINNALDGVGATLSLSPGRDELSIGARCLGDDLGLVIDLLAEMLIEPAFSARELERFQGLLLTDMAELERDTGYRARLAFAESLYSSEHTYGRPLMGRPESVAALTGDDLAALCNQHLHPQGAILTLVGSLEPDAVLDRLNAALGRWRPASTPPVWSNPMRELPPARVMRTIDIPARPQLDLMYGVLSMRRHREDYIAGVLANVILGELGMMGRLGAAIRDDQGLAYDIGSDLYANRAQRSWVVTAGVAPEHLDETIKGIEQQIEAMRQDLVSPEELDDAKSLLIGSLPLSMETNQGIAHYLLSTESYDLGTDYVRRYPDIIRAVNADDVRDVMRRYWPQGRAVVSAAGTLSP
ncbi:MAG: pitrilysin family protein [Anaerolineae bacterium]